MNTEDFAVIESHINMFANNDDDSLILPFELTNKERAYVHDYVNTKLVGITSESVTLKCSSNKKIMLRRVKHNLDLYLAIQGKTVMIVPSSEEIDMFIHYSSCPIPCPFSEYLAHFIRVYDPLYDTIAKWNLFTTELQTLALKKEADTAMKQIKSHISNNIEYQNMMKIPFKGPDGKMKKDVYRISKINKYFVSIDIKQGQVTVLREKCRSVFQNEHGEDLSWYQFVKQFTKSDFIAGSKYFREVCFGNIGFSGKANTLQEIYMDDVHKIVLEWGKENNIELIPQMKAGDENVYELLVPDAFVLMIDSIKTKLGKRMSNLHIRIFKVEQIEQKNYFLKTFTYNTDWFDSNGNLNPVSADSLKAKIEFKCVPKSFMPQVIKWYTNEKIVEEDLIFMDEGTISKRLVTIFDKSI